jgi:uncharacterized membrane protein
MAKKQAVLQTQRKSRLPLLLGALGLGVVVVAAGILFKVGLQKPAPPTAAAQEVTHLAALFDDGKARHFEFRATEGITVRYFVLKSADGVIRAAFDACDVCWPAGKGYVQDGDFMVCHNCGQRFASNKVNEVKGGCNPAPLAREVKNGQLVLRVRDILEGKGYFDFSRRTAS